LGGDVLVAATKASHNLLGRGFSLPFQVLPEEANCLLQGWFFFGGHVITSFPPNLKKTINLLYNPSLF
jgi:hypothetical protein